MSFDQLVQGVPGLMEATDVPRESLKYLYQTLQEMASGANRIVARSIAVTPRGWYVPMVGMHVSTQVHIQSDIFP